MSETHHETEPLSLHRAGPFAALVGIVGIIAILVGVTSNPTVWHSYIFAFITFASLTFGSFGLLLLMHTVNGSWGLPVLRIFEAAANWRTMVLLFVLFLPILFTVVTNKGALYPWVDPVRIAADHVIQKKQAYLNPVGFTIRLFAYFLIWIGLSRLLQKSTLRQDETNFKREQDRRASWGAPGLVAFVLTMTFAFTDWVMSLEPHWSSTIYGAWWVVGMCLMAFAFVTIIATLNKDREPFAGQVTPSWTKDMGNLMLTFTMLWGYTSLSQYLIIWSGNVPETISFYVARSNHHWNAIGMATVLGQFFVPFFALLSPRIKAQPQLLAKLCGWILVMRLVDMYYVIMPAMRETPAPSAWDFIALVAVGGWWVWGFANSLKKGPLAASYDPRLLEVEAHAH